MEEAGEIGEMGERDAFAQVYIFAWLRSTAIAARKMK
jgi:hypothetical protein